MCFAEPGPDPIIVIPCVLLLLCAFGALAVFKIWRIINKPVNQVHKHTDSVLPLTHIIRHEFLFLYSRSVTHLLQVSLLTCLEF